MANFESALDACLRNEGGYVLSNVAGDAGGETFAGIARTRHPDWEGWQAIDRGDRDSATLRKAVQRFYRKEFWQPIRGDDIKREAIARSLFDFAVNAGVKTASRLAQEAAGAYPDGIIGPKTLAKLNAQTVAEFVPRFALQKLAYYADICTRHPVQKKFLLGWLNRTLRDAGVTS